MSTLIAYISDNAVQIDAVEGEATLRKDCPSVLEEDEFVKMAFRDRGGKGRDDMFFTSKRIFIRDKKGMTGKKIKYFSVPYSAIKSYSVETAGTMDSDCSLKIHCSGVGILSFDFVTGVDIFAIKRHFNEMVLVLGSIGFDAEVGVAELAKLSSEASTGFLDIMGSNYGQIDPETVEVELKLHPYILMADEKVNLAFKCGRDTFVLTSKRILQIDVKGISGKRVEYLTILWKCVRAFSVETAGSFDRDSELTLFTNISGQTRIGMDFRKGKVDLFAIQKLFTDKLLGMDTADVSDNSISAEGYQDSGSVSVFSWLGDDSRMIDATEMDQRYHSNPPILQGCEFVEMAFKGRRDLILFTSKRLLIVDTQGFSGKSVNYKSFPWKTIQAFGVKSAGSFLDKDSEMLIWTDLDDVFWPPPKNQDDPPPPPIPRNSFLELDFQKDKVDLMAVHRYLSERCIHLDEDGYMPSDVPVSQDVMGPSPTNAVENFLSWVGDDGQEIDPKTLDDQLHTVNPMLQSDEHVEKAFKSGRDITMFTTKRVLIMDTKGWSGKKIEWKSIPYTSIRAYSVESAGSWDTDSELGLFCKTYWMDRPSSVFKQDFRKGKADIITIQNLITAHVIGAQDGSSALDQDTNVDSEGALGGFLAWAAGDGAAVNAEAVNEKLHTSPPILQSNESVDLAFKSGRDLCIFTTKRVLFVDVQGLTGKRVEYTSYPLCYCVAFKVNSAGSIGFFKPPKVSIFTDVPGNSQIKYELKESSSDIWAVQTMLGKKIMR